MRRAARPGLVLAGPWVFDLLPTVTAIGPLRRRFAPGLSGAGKTDHVALSFDDGPDATTTAGLLDCLQALGVRATMFVLAPRLARMPELARRIRDDGHEVALHGLSHRPHVLRAAPLVAVDIRRSHGMVRDVVGTPPRFWRPPHGIATTTGLAVARSLDMRPVLWTRDARDWRSGRNAATVCGDLRRTVRGGDTVLLHEGVQAEQPPRTAGDVLPDLVAWCAARGWRVGPLGEHGLDATGTQSWN